MSPTFYVAIGMLIAFVIAAIIQRDKQQGTNIVYNHITNQIGLIIFDNYNEQGIGYYRIHTHGVWSHKNCTRLNREQCNKLLGMSNVSWLNPQKPDLRILSLL